MKTFKITITILLILSLGLSMTACSISKEDVVGTWEGTWNNNGNHFSATLILRSDDSYYYELYQNGRFFEEKSGLYVIDGDKVILRPYNGEDGIVYRYEDGTLKSGGTLYRVH